MAFGSTFFFQGMIEKRFCKWKSLEVYTKQWPSLVTFFQIEVGDLAAATWLTDWLQSSFRPTEISENSFHFHANASSSLQDGNTLLSIKEETRPGQERDEIHDKIGS